MQVPITKAHFSSNERTHRELAEHFINTLGTWWKYNSNTLGANKIQWEGSTCAHGGPYFHLLRMEKGNTGAWNLFWILVFSPCSQHSFLIYAIGLMTFSMCFPSFHLFFKSFINNITFYPMIFFQNLTLINYIFSLTIGNGYIIFYWFCLIKALWEFILIKYKSKESKIGLMDKVIGVSFELLSKVGWVEVINRNLGKRYKLG
jgi:hypothetical protein